MWFDLDYFLFKLMKIQLLVTFSISSHHFQKIKVTLSFQRERGEGDKKKAGQIFINSWTTSTYVVGTI